MAFVFRSEKTTINIHKKSLNDSPGPGAYIGHSQLKPKYPYNVYFSHFVNFSGKSAFASRSQRMLDNSNSYAPGIF